MDAFYLSAAFLPIIILLVVSLLKGVKFGIYSGFIVTSFLFFIWDSQFIAFPAALFAAFVNTISILMIVFGALLLHQNMEHGGFIDDIKDSLKKVHHNSGFQFYFLAFFLTAFFESVAGFGTPGAIVPLLLISLGFSPILSIVVVLLIDGLFAISGAIGTPVIAGFENTIKHPLKVELIYLYASVFMVFSGLILLFFIKKFVQKENPEIKKYSLKLFLAVAIPFVGLSLFLKELTGVVAAILMAAIAFFFLFTNKKLDWKPWLPYIILVLLLFLPKIIQPLQPFITFSLQFDDIFGSDVDTSFQPFRSPLFPFVFAAFSASIIKKKHTLNMKPVLKKTLSIFLILFPSLAITQLMLSSGNNMPSMVENMATLFTKTGDFYVILSPFVGLIGTFITGSTTVSNIIFSSVQYNAASNLNLSTEVILAMQLNGASLGNAICLFNIIAAAAVAGVSKYVTILNKNILPIICATFVTAILGLILLQFI